MPTCSDPQCKCNQSDTTEIDNAELDYMREIVAIYDSLMAAGVDSWEGYEIAMENVEW